MLIERDKAFLNKLEGGGDTVRELCLRCFMRRGDLLMVLPYGREAALKTLSLYQPQSLVAKLYTRFVKLLVLLGMAGVLRSIRLNIKESSPLTEIAQQGEVGFLLGNPHGRARRVICLHRNETNQWLVTKIGMDGAGRQTVVDEAEILMKLPNTVDGPQRLVSDRCESAFASYTVRLIEGKSPRIADEAVVLDCLVAWQGDELIQLEELLQWQTLHACVEDINAREWLSTVARRQVYPTVVHGDFAPWNIKIDRSGKVHVLDWEFCRQGGAAGWDWAHYLIQVGLLVKKRSSADVLANVRNWAQTEVGREHLRKTGWGSEVHAWLGTYLLYTHYVLKQDREELIECWKKLK